MCILNREFCPFKEGGWQLEASFSQSFLLQFLKSQCQCCSKYPEYSKKTTFAFWMSLEVDMDIFPINDILFETPCISNYLPESACCSFYSTQPHSKRHRKRRAMWKNPRFTTSRCSLTRQFSCRAWATLQWTARSSISRTSSAPSSQQTHLSLTSQPQQQNLRQHQHPPQPRLQHQHQQR